MSFTRQPKVCYPINDVFLEPLGSPFKRMLLTELIAKPTYRKRQPDNIISITIKKFHKMFSGLLGM